MSEIKEEKKVVGKAGGLWTEFKQFALKGNVIELAIAVVVGSAFSRIVNSLVADIIQPLMALLGNPQSVGSGTIVLRATSTPATGGQPTASVVLNYGSFTEALTSFIIVAGSIFLVIKIISVARNRLFRKEAMGEVPPPPKAEDVKLLEEIRDLLKEENHSKS